MGRGLYDSFFLPNFPPSVPHSFPLALKFIVVVIYYCRYLLLLSISLLSSLFVCTHVQTYTYHDVHLGGRGQLWGIILSSQHGFWG